MVGKVLLAICNFLLLINVPNGRTPIDPLLLIVYTQEDILLPGQLLYLTADGLMQTLTLPSSIAMEVNVQQGTKDIHLSADLSQLVLVYTASPSTLIVVHLPDLITSYWTLPDQPHLNPGDFSVDGSRLSVSYYDELHTRGGLVTLDVRTGQVKSQITLDEIARQQPAIDPSPAFFSIEEWRYNGIYFVPNCSNCSPTGFDYPYYVWDPLNNTIEPAADAYYSIFGSTLSATGELLYTVMNPKYEIIASDSILLPNVVEYYLDGVPTYGYSSRKTSNPAINFNLPVAYHDGNQVQLQTAQWVLDGHAFLVMDTPLTSEEASIPPPLATHGMIMYRNNTLQGMPFDTGLFFLAGTPDGWLMSNEKGVVTHFRVDGISAGSDIVMKSIANLPGSAQVVYSPPLGQSLLNDFHSFPLRGGETSWVTEDYGSKWHLAHLATWDINAVDLNNGHLEMNGDYRGHSYSLRFDYPSFENDIPQSLDTWNASYTAGTELPIIPITLMNIPSRMILNIPTGTSFQHLVLIWNTEQQPWRTVSIVQTDDLPFDSEQMRGLLEALLMTMVEVSAPF